MWHGPEKQEMVASRYPMDDSENDEDDDVERGVSRILFEYLHPAPHRPSRISQECEVGARVGWHAAKRKGLDGAACFGD
jgi:hypothetical protein